MYGGVVSRGSSGTGLAQTRLPASYARPPQAPMEFTQARQLAAANQSKGGSAPSDLSPGSSGGGARSLAEMAKIRTVEDSEGLSPAEVVALQSRIELMENVLRDTGSRMKLETLNPFSASGLIAKAQQMQQQLQEARQLRHDYEAKASHLEQLLQQERKERQAWLDTFSKALQKTLKDLSVCVDQSFAESNRLMKGRLDVADATMKKLITQMNSSLSMPPSPSAMPGTPSVGEQPGGQQVGSNLQSANVWPPQQAQLSKSPPDPKTHAAEDIGKSLAKLLEENKLLEQRQRDLMKERQAKHGSSRGSRRSPQGSGTPHGIGVPLHGLAPVPERY
eukprot:CAMPEP_0197627844 /NCGR_PEP_ID=MMETSP1338-20131121/6340_1 /TAXON_ID=43686 ORGANISM="Pelagodinium beii, Strain RCC1491" /NCGR_SAMPLE_ID=MMETSP1338 /ASSEMBLY_ACC=CAM_ASM_000754 /LENGTH=333 /DNA_ID=CAMNT_0043198671 /DNA_START=31 /DNA_END=1032 /DNA_ORIENTATION=+